MNLEDLGSLGQLLIGLAVFMVSFYLLVDSRRVARISTHEAMLQSFNETLRFALQDDRNLLTLAELVYPDRASDLDELRRYLTSLTVYNSLELVLVAKRNRGLDAALADNIVSVVLANMVTNPTSNAALGRGTQDSELIVLADRIRRTLQPPASPKGASRD